MRRRPQQPAWSKSGSRTSPPSKYLFGNPCVQCNPCYAVARVRTPSRPAAIMMNRCSSQGKQQIKVSKIHAISCTNLVALKTENTSDRDSKITHRKRDRDSKSLNPRLRCSSEPVSTTKGKEVRSKNSKRKRRKKEIHGQHARQNAMDTCRRSQCKRKQLQGTNKSTTAVFFAIH